MALIASINGVTRRVYLNAAEAVGGVLTFHPTVDMYTAYKALRAADESVRPFDAFMAAAGNLPKGGGKFTPRFTTLLAGTKVVIPAGITEVNVTGELLTDDGSKPFDTSLVTGPCVINYQPAEAEVIKVTASGNEYSLEQIGSAVWANATGAAVAARLAEAWGRLGLDPSAPLVTGETSITFGDIALALSQAGSAVTLTRQ